MGKYLRKNKIKKNIPIRAAAVLLCLTLFSIYLVSGLFARYTSGTQNGDSARVAKFSIRSGSTLSRSVEASFYPGKSETATLLVENDSEVSVSYAITVTNETNNLPLSLRLEKKNSSLTDGTAFTDQRLQSGCSDEYTLYIDWDASHGDPAVMGMVDYITVTVTAVQID